MKTKLQLLVMGVNQTLVIALLPQFGAHLGLSQDTQEWGWLIALLNVNLLTYWLASGWWGNRISAFGLQKSQRIAAIGLIFSTFVFAIAFLFSAEISLVLIGMSRFATGCFTSAFLPIAQSKVAQTHGNNIAALSKQSSYITVGRLLGPGLILLPVSFYILLFLPCVIAVISLFISEKEPPQHTPSEMKLNPFHGLSQLPCTGLVLAMSTTAIVACTQLIILPFIIGLGYNPEQSTVAYAQLMLYISLFVIIAQRWLIPFLSSTNRIKQHYPYLLLAILHLGTGLLFFTFSQWIFFALALSFIAISITGLPSWYTNQLLKTRNVNLSHSQVSGGVAQAHTLGHLLGTGLSATILSTTSNPELMLWPLAVVISVCTYRLSKKTTTQDKTLNLDLIPPSQSKGQNENA